MVRPSLTSFSVTTSSLLSCWGQTSSPQTKILCANRSLTATTAASLRSHSWKPVLRTSTSSSKSRTHHFSCSCRRVVLRCITSTKWVLIRACNNLTLLCRRARDSEQKKSFRVIYLANYHEGAADSFYPNNSLLKAIKYRGGNTMSRESIVEGESFLGFRRSSALQLTTWSVCRFK